MSVDPQISFNWNELSAYSIFVAALLCDNDLKDGCSVVTSCKLLAESGSHIQSYLRINTCYILVKKAYAYRLALVESILMQYDFPVPSLQYNHSPPQPSGDATKSRSLDRKHVEPIVLTKWRHSAYVQDPNDKV